MGIGRGGGRALGRAIDTADFSPEERIRYREKLKAGLLALRYLVDEGRIAPSGGAAGIELELYLTDEDGRAAPVNTELGELLPPGLFQSELARFNGEIDISHRRLSGDALTSFARDMTDTLARVEGAAAHIDTHVVTVGILPTLTVEDVSETNLTREPRYRALNDAILAARGERIRIHIEGEQTLVAETPTILFEAACTSMQLHVDTAADEFAAYWNAAQLLAGPIVAAAANSPLFLGRPLHHETRIALFEQSVDTRTEELEAQGVRPRVWFGERWLARGVVDLFEENVTYFPALLPVCDDEDPLAVVAADGVPHLPELTLHNGTIYRWNRPVYAVVDGEPRIRIENRVLPAGPTVVDAVANAALFYGLVRALAESDPPLWERMSFESARDNFFAAARAGLGARMYWPRVGAAVPADELLVRHLLPLAHAGLRAWGIDDDDRQRYLDVIEERVLRGQNGAVWQRETLRTLTDEQGLTDEDAARELVRRYRKQAATGEPVHTWPR